MLIVVSGPSAIAAPTPPRATADLDAAVITSDPVADLAARLEYDTDRIFRYVADEIRYEPYLGLLRGARGTLTARAGNSVDKSALLAALLDASLVPYRFVRGPLDDTATGTLLATLPADLAVARQIAQDPLVTGIEQVQEGGPTAPPAPVDDLGSIDEAQLRAVEADGARRLAVASTRLADTVTMLEDALQTAGVQLPSGGDVTLPSPERDQHTWVQVGSGPDWVDLDPTLPRTQRGTVVARAVETLAALPDDLRYPVEFDVLVERLSGGQLATDQVLSYVGFADELADTPVTFGHVTPSALASLGHSVGNLLGGGWVDYRPVLQVGGRSLIGDASVPFPSGDGTDLFGAEPSGSTAAGVVDGEATAEWLEVRVTPPGAEPEVARRTVFDRLPADRRAVGDLTPSAIEPVQLVDVDRNGSLDFPPMQGIRTFVVATGPTTAASVAADIGDPLGMFARSYHGIRDAMSSAMALDAGARTFLDGPNIVSLTIGVDGDATTQTVRVGLDIWQRDHGSLPLVGESVGAARSELIAGVLAQIAERFAVEALSGIPKAPVTTVGVSEVFEAAATREIETLVLRGAAPDDLPYGAGATARIRAAVAAGDVVVIPARPVEMGNRERVGWWQVDPTTGETVDVMDDGSGQDMTEYTVIVDSEVGRLICMGTMALAVAEVIVAAAVAAGSFGATSVYWTYAEGSGVGGTSCGAI